MFHRFASVVVYCVLFSVVATGCSQPAKPSLAPKNVILLVGDGMGFEHIKAAGLYANGAQGTLFMETLPYKGQVVTSSANKPNRKTGAITPTDSAAAASAFATGHKVFNASLSIANPGNGKPYKTVLESFAAEGKMTGLISTAYITDATPAAFAAHTGRNNQPDIMKSYLYQVRPNILMGGSPCNPNEIRHAGYELLVDRTSLAAFVPSRGCHVFGLFGIYNMPTTTQLATQPADSNMRQLPTLPEMAQAALNIASVEPDGFFLMIEGGLIDKVCHNKDTASCVHEVLGFDETVRVVMEWARQRNDTLVIVVSDHETGGLTVQKSNGKGTMPNVTWSTSKHTNANVPLFAWGVGADRIVPVMDNTDIYHLMMGTFEPAPPASAAVKQPATRLEPATRSAQ